MFGDLTGKVAIVTGAGQALVKGLQRYLETRRQGCCGHGRLQ